MKTLLVILSLLVVALAMPSFALAKKGKNQGPPPDTGELKIVQVDALSITVSVGLSGDEHFTYRINEGTKVTLNGAPVSARDLKAGMLAKISVGPDKSTALTVEAKDPPARIDKHHVG